METALLAEWHAELVSLLARQRRGSDASDAQVIARIETTLVSFIDGIVLKNLPAFFPGVSPAATLGTMLHKDRRFVVGRVSRGEREPNTLQLIVLEQSVARQPKVQVAVVVGLPPVSGINECKIYAPAGLQSNVPLLKALISQTFLVGYDWAIERLARMISRHFDDLGEPFYKILQPFVKAGPKRATHRLLLTFYYKGQEYPLLDSDVVRRFVGAIDGRIGKLPRQSLMEFARFHISVIKDADSPFSELIDKRAPVNCSLETSESSFYGPNSGVNRFMQSIYRDAVVLYPIVFRDDITLAANFHPGDTAILAPVLDLAGPALGNLLDGNKKNVIRSLVSLQTLKQELERDRVSRIVGATVFGLERLPDIIDIAKAAVETGAKIVGGG